MDMQTPTFSIETGQQANHTTRLRTMVFLVLLLAILPVMAVAQVTPWSSYNLTTPPVTFPAPGFSSPGVTALFYNGLSWKGKPTRVFAWIGIPPKPVGGGLVPGVVLIHGGNGTAYADWVRLWNSRGYAAIAMDTSGATPGAAPTSSPVRHAFGGPSGWGGLSQIDEPTQDQWAFHAVADVILAHSLLRSNPNVDAQRIGVTGISWGGFLTCLAASADARFKFAAPVYGCGFLADNSAWLSNFKAMGPTRTERWVKLWDPSSYLASATMPFLWVTGSNDFFFPLDSLQKSYRLPPGERRLCVRLLMPHGQGPGQSPAEIHAFAASVLNGGAPML
jgi:dienelactone hydrolase